MTVTEAIESKHGKAGLNNVMTALLVTQAKARSIYHSTIDGVDYYNANTEYCDYLVDAGLLRYKDVDAVGFDEFFSQPQGTTQKRVYAIGDLD